MDKEVLKARTKQFALRVIKIVNVLPKTTVGFTIGKQLVRSGTSVGANYRAVCRSQSRADFLAKIAIVIEEADESAFWLELIIESGLMEEGLVAPLLNEADEITAIMVSSRITASNNKDKS